MIKLLLFLSVFSSPWFYFNKIHRANTLKKQAAEAYSTHFYSDAIIYYDELLTKYEPDSDHIKINLAHSYYRSQDYNNAGKLYTELTIGTETGIRSTALCQLGIIQHRTKHYKLALFYFKEALRVNPANKTAAFNYEFLKITLRKETNTDGQAGSNKGDAESSKKKDDTSADNTMRSQNKFDADGSSESAMYYRMLYEQQRLSKQRAEKILQYIQEQEMQYYNQLQKHVPHDANKPDW